MTSGIRCGESLMPEGTDRPRRRKKTDEETKYEWQRRLARASAQHREDRYSPDPSDAHPVPDRLLHRDAGDGHRLYAQPRSRLGDRAALAAVTGLTDYLGDERIRRLGDALKHMLANVTAVVLELVNLLLRLNNND